MTTFDTRCTQTRLCDVEEKLDRLVEMVERLNGIRAFGSDIAANVIGNLLVR